MVDAKTFAARFNQALDELPPGQRPPRKGSGRQQFVAQMFHISQKGARKWLEGEAFPRLARIPQIALKCGVNGDWLLTGQGPMRPAAPAGTTTSKGQIGEPAALYHLSPRTRRLVAQVSQAQAEGILSEADIAAIEGIVLRLIDR